ncbi:MAG: hypothetical protein NT003_03195 [Candidatus Magasanikbacteria bacterium]|nr:hypothetical protein [Candidatus Magasanikbacteria bacterium]
MKFLQATPGIPVPRIRWFLDDVPLGPPTYSMQRALSALDAMPAPMREALGITQSVIENYAVQVKDLATQHGLPPNRTEDDLRSLNIAAISNLARAKHPGKHVNNLYIMLEMHYAASDIPVVMSWCGKSCCPSNPTPGIPCVQFGTVRDGLLSLVGPPLASTRLFYFIIEQSELHPVELNQFRLPETARRTIEASLTPDIGIAFENPTYDLHALRIIEKMTHVQLAELYFAT